MIEITTEDVRDTYVPLLDDYGTYVEGGYGPQFDGWLESIKAEAWDEGYSASTEDSRWWMSTPTKNPYRA